MRRKHSMSNDNRSETAPSVPRQYSLVRLVQWYRDFLAENGNSELPLAQENVFVFLGEIPNMKGHCVVAGQESGRVFSGYHIENFEEMDENEP
jgi:hypothetical protein